MFKNLDSALARREMVAPDSSVSVALEGKKDTALKILGVIATIGLAFLGLVPLLAGTATMLLGSIAIDKYKAAKRLSATLTAKQMDELFTAVENAQAVIGIVVDGPNVHHDESKFPPKPTKPEANIRELGYDDTSMVNFGKRLDKIVKSAESFAAACNAALKQHEAAYERLWQAGLKKDKDFSESDGSDALWASFEQTAWAAKAIMKVREDALKLISRNLKRLATVYTTK